MLIHRCLNPDTGLDKNAITDTKRYDKVPHPYSFLQTYLDTVLSLYVYNVERFTVLLPLLYTINQSLASLLMHCTLKRCYEVQNAKSVFLLYVFFHFLFIVTLLHPVMSVML